jgi:hypothetical protein
MSADVLIPLIGALLLGLATNAIYDFLLLFLPVIGTSNFSLKGIWVSSFYPEVGQQGHSIEIYKIRQRGNKVLFNLENYNSDRKTIKELEGRGKLTVSQFSAYYYHKDQRSPDSGTFTFRLKSSKDGEAVLNGVYTEVMDREHVFNPKPVSQEATLHRIDLPLSIQLKAIFRKTYFDDYKQAQQFLDSSQ